MEARGESGDSGSSAPFSAGAAVSDVSRALLELDAGCGGPFIGLFADCACAKGPAEIITMTTPTETRARLDQQRSSSFKRIAVWTSRAERVRRVNKC
jgi:hypothetical protein